MRGRWLRDLFVAMLRLPRPPCLSFPILFVNVAVANGCWTAASIPGDTLGTGCPLLAHISRPLPCVPSTISSLGDRSHPP